jgi:hypothetical protein
LFGNGEFAALLARSTPRRGEIRRRFDEREREREREREKAKERERELVSDAVDAESDFEPFEDATNYYGKDDCADAFDDEGFSARYFDQE